MDGVFRLSNLGNGVFILSRNMDYYDNLRVLHYSRVVEKNYQTTPNTGNTTINPTNGAIRICGGAHKMNKTESIRKILSARFLYIGMVLTIPQFLEEKPLTRIGKSGKMKDG